jgi:hypothetical protein
VDLLDESNYDFVIKTDNKTPQEVCDEIIAAFENYQKSHKNP